MACHDSKSFESTTSTVCGIRLKGVTDTIPLFSRHELTMHIRIGAVRRPIFQCQCFSPIGIQVVWWTYQFLLSLLSRRPTFGRIRGRGLRTTFPESASTAQSSGCLDPPVQGWAGTSSQVVVYWGVCITGDRGAHSRIVGLSGNCGRPRTRTSSVQELGIDLTACS
jgi:hypothetical protein